jgi:hypothetical protein
MHDAQNEPPYHAFTLLSKYHALVLKIHQDVNIITQDTHNLELFYDLEIMLWIPYIIPMHEGLNEWINS